MPHWTLQHVIICVIEMPMLLTVDIVVVVDYLYPIQRCFA